MPRLFVALGLPEDVTDDLDALCGFPLPTARWVPAEQQHLTLRFIGEVEGRRVDDLAEALAEVTTPPFELRLKGIGHFPPRGELRALWAGVEPSPPLRQLKRQVDAALRRAGLPPEGRKFSPHVTLARFRGPPPVERLAAYLRRYSLYSGPAFTVGGFQLYSSHRQAGGPDYIVEAAYELAPGFDALGW